MSGQNELHDAFIKYDTDKSGYVSLEEAFTVLKDDLGYSKSNTERLLASCDVNSDNKLEYSEFITFFKKVKERKAELQDAFTAMDIDGNGYVSLEEAKKGLKHLEMEDAEIVKLFKTCDKNNDDKLEFEEFKDLWNN